MADESFALKPGSDIRRAARDGQAKPDRNLLNAGCGASGAAGLAARLLSHSSRFPPIHLVSPAAVVARPAGCDPGTCSTFEAAPAS